ncbi:MAG: hypothetical protein GF398_21395 [Chitinivibrionales bacterium]|nr:hypothetical protein [Chitinivibrionales bacterium]
MSACYLFSLVAICQDSKFFSGRLSEVIIPEPRARRMSRFTAVVSVVALAGLVWLSCTDNSAEPAQRFSIAAMNDTVVYAGNTLCLLAFSNYAADSLLLYEWQFGQDTASLDTTLTGVKCTTWSVSDTGFHTVYVRAVDTSGNISDGDTIYAYVLPCSISIAATDAIDTVAAVGDTTSISLEITSPCEFVGHFIWQLASAVDTTAVGSFAKVWTINDTGSREIQVRAVSISGLTSDTLAVPVTVIASAPSLVLAQDTSVFVCDTVVFRAAQTAGQSPLAQYHWALDSDSFGVVSLADSLTYAWGQADTGWHSVKVRGIDSLGLTSNIDSVSVFVGLGGPELEPVADTTIATTDTLTVHIQASDTNGMIQKFLLGNALSGWRDSSDTCAMQVVYQGNDSEFVVIGIRDDDGLIATDTFVIDFNYQPDHLRILAPGSGESIYLRKYDSTFYTPQIAFAYASHDSDGAPDTLDYSVQITNAQQEEVYAYAGRDTVHILELDTGAYVCRVTATDRFGAGISTQGGFAVYLHTTVCFLGHSIVEGAGGSSHHGGFRLQVLNTMISKQAGHQFVAPKGPFFSSKMTDKQLDSCFAVSGSWGGMMRNLYENSFPKLSADLYVVMLGVNWQYSYLEKENIRSILNEVYTRNAHAHVYFVNGLPYPDSWNSAFHSRVSAFNAEFRDSIAAWNQIGRKIWNVDVHSSFVDSAYQRVDSLFDDDLHPNQAGYNRMASSILNSMAVGEEWN